MVDVKTDPKKLFQDVSEKNFCAFLECKGDIGEVSERLSKIARYYENENMRLKHLVDNGDTVRKAIATKKVELKLLRDMIYDKLRIQKDAGEIKHTEPAMQAVIGTTESVWNMEKEIVDLETSMFPIRAEQEACKGRMESLQILRDSLKGLNKTIVNEQYG